jgi:hypothetical protein
MRVGGQRHAPTALPPGQTRYPLWKGLGRLHGRSGRVRKISPSVRDPWTVQHEIKSLDRPRNKVQQNIKSRDEDWLSASWSTVSGMRLIQYINKSFLFRSVVYYFLYKENYGHVSVI